MDKKSVENQLKEVALNFEVKAVKRECHLNNMITISLKLRGNSLMFLTANTKLAVKSSRESFKDNE